MGWNLRRPVEPTRLSDRGEVHQHPVAPVTDYCHRPVPVAYFVVSFGTAPWPRFTVVSVLTDVSLLMIVVSWVCLGVITVSLACPTRSVCPELHPARLTATSAPASMNRMSVLRVTAPRLAAGGRPYHGPPTFNFVPGRSKGAVMSLTPPGKSGRVEGKKGSSLAAA
jgi:hypothetical protein